MKYCGILSIVLVLLSIFKVHSQDVDNILENVQNFRLQQFYQQLQQQELKNLKQDFTRISDWPDIRNYKLGSVSAVAFDKNKNVVIFQRGDHIWNDRTFNEENNIYNLADDGPIAAQTIITFQRDNGKILDQWGANLFYMPHGLTIDGDLYYVTDVALHQVLRFNVTNSKTTPDLVLGQKFQPGKGTSFCKPTAVATIPCGDFFVADGYCNSRIVKFNSNGDLIAQWGRNTFTAEVNFGSRMPPPNFFAVPHALTVVPENDLLCVADRENGRIQCFHTTNGTFYSQYHSPLIGTRLFSVDYAQGSLFVVNGPTYFENDGNEVAGYEIDMKTGKVLSKFGSFKNPHDIAVLPDGKEVYVAETDPNLVHKFVLKQN
jgi:peptidylamidoglycolate lyase